MKNSCDFYFLAKDLSVSGIMRPIKKLLKHARFFSAGDIELGFYGKVPSDSHYLYRVKTGECFIIDNYEYSLSEGGEMMCTLFGRSLEAVLCDRVITGDEFYSGNVENSIRQLVSRYAIDCESPIPTLVLGEQIGLEGDLLFLGSGKTLSKRLYDILSLFGLSYKIRCDFENARLVFELWQGGDRRWNCPDGRCALLWDKRGNIADYSYKRSHLPYNRIYVCSSTHTVCYDISDGKDVRELYFYAHDARKGNMTDSEFKDYLVGVGMEKLASVNKKATLEISFDTSAYPKYPSAFDVGDLCDIIIAPVDGAFEGRLAELEERVSDGKRILKGKFILN